MFSLWSHWQRGEQLSHGLAKWNHVFEHLRDIRLWGVKDRLLESGLLDDWKERVEHAEEVLPGEIELWFRRDPTARLGARNRVVELVISEQGRVLQDLVVEDIAYHGLLVELPARAVSQVIAGVGDDVALVQCEQIQFFRATGQMAGILPEDERTTDEIYVAEPETGLGNLGDPVIALLDGLPLQNHRRFLGRLSVDDPDDIE